MKTSLDMRVSSLMYVAGCGSVGSCVWIGLALSVICSWVVMVPCRARSCVSAEYEGHRPVIFEHLRELTASSQRREGFLDVE
jgi:hypothetical protein